MRPVGYRRWHSLEPYSAVQLVGAHDEVASSIANQRNPAPACTILIEQCRMGTECAHLAQTCLISLQAYASHLSDRWHRKREFNAGNGRATLGECMMYPCRPARTAQHSVELTRYHRLNEDTVAARSPPPPPPAPPFQGALARSDPDHPQTRERYQKKKGCRPAMPSNP